MNDLGETEAWDPIAGSRGAAGGGSAREERRLPAQEREGGKEEGGAGADAPGTGRPGLGQPREDENGVHRIQPRAQQPARPSDSSDTAVKVVASGAPSVCLRG